MLQPLPRRPDQQCGTPRVADLPYKRTRCPLPWLAGVGGGSGCGRLRRRKLLVLHGRLTLTCGGLGSRPDRRTRRAILHLQYSCAAPCGPALLVTQDPIRNSTWGSLGLSSRHPRQRGTHSVKGAASRHGPFQFALGALGYNQRRPAGKYCKPCIRIADISLAPVATISLRVGRSPQQQY